MRLDPRMFFGQNPSPSVFANLEVPKVEQVKPVKKVILNNFFKTIVKKGSLVTLGNSRSRPLLSSLFKNCGFRMFGIVFSHGGKYLSRMRQLWVFLVHIQNMNRHHGASTVVKYLKASQLAIQKAIAGNPISSLRALDPSIPFPYLATCGLPKIIPVRDRRLILINYSPSVIRWWLTLFSVYRVIEIPGNLKLETITGELSVSEHRVIKITEELVKLINPDMFDTQSVYRQSQILFMETASATNKVAWLGIVSDTLALYKQGLGEPLVKFLRLTGNFQLAGYFEYLNMGLAALKGRFTCNTDFWLQNVIGSVGKLSIKDEAAGKRRVFAMVDVWTQSSLKPIHNMLFKFLKVLPNDGTFDQNASVSRCMVKSQITGKSFGYDLTAATDRLPVICQSAILDKIFPGIGVLWKELLTNRDYLLKEKDKPLLKLRYAVGQPMGAYSSWAMLAVNHHLIAQLAAYRAQFGNGRFWISNKIDYEIFNMESPWYTGYEVLGDDIVFFENDVAKEYLLIMEELGVPINLMKSVIANNPTFEFAKVTGNNGNHVAALSWAALMSQPSLMGRASYAFALFQKGIVKRHPISYLKALWRESRYTLGSPNAFMVALGTMFSKAGRFPLYDFLYSVAKRSMGAINVYDTLVHNTNLVPLQRAISECVLTDGKVEIPNPLIRRSGWKTEEFEIKQNCATSIRAFLYGHTKGGVITLPLNPEVDALRAAQTMVELSPFALGPAAKECNPAVFSWDKDLQKSLSPEEMFIHNIFLMISVPLYERLIGLYQEIAEFDIDPFKYSLDELFSALEKIKRYQEIKDLPNRGINKLIGKEIPNRNLLENPLELLKLLSELGESEIEVGGSNAIYTSNQTMINYMSSLAKLENIPVLAANQQLISESSDSGYNNYLQQYFG